uniref:Uncharacterized protein n=1 Tax=Meloidogyne javanica TaxID=6303 RepID=A0A915M5X4_MELJA
MITNSRQIRISLFEIDAADPCENPCHDNHLKEECKGLYDDDKQLAQHYSNIFFGENEKYFLRNLSGINIIIWHRNIDYKLTNKSEWNKNSQKFRVWALEIWEKMEDEFDKHYCYFFNKDVNIEDLKSISKKVPKLFENIFDIITGLNNKASIKINKDVEGSTFKENFKNKLRSLNDDLYKKMNEENDIESKVNRIEETFGSKYSQEIAIRIVEQSQAKINLELEGKSDSKKEEIEVEEILNVIGIIDNDKKDISSSRNSNKRSRKNLSKKQKKHVEANKVNIVENTKQYLEGDIDDNTKNTQSLNNEIKSRNVLSENSKLKEENKEVKCEKDDKFKSAEKDDKALVSSNKIVNSSNISPFTPINYLEEDALNERYMRFISSNEDPRKIIPSLDLGVIVDELNKRFKHFQKIRMKNNCQDKNVNLTFGEFQGTDLI